MAKKYYYMRAGALAVLLPAVICALVFIPLRGNGQNTPVEITAQGILARVDRVLDYPQGQLKGTIKHIRPDGTSYTADVTASISKDSYLFVFGSSDRGSQMKVLYTMKGEDIWVYSIHALKLFHKMGIDRFDPILATNFTFIDLSNADLQSNYNATLAGEAFVKDREAYKLTLKPIYSRGQYGMLTLYVSKDRFIPLRIDFHDVDNAIFKFMTVAKTMEKNGRIFPVRYDMMDIRKGTVTILSVFDIDDSMTFDPSIFRPEKLGE